MTGRGVRCYNYHFQYLFFSNRMCSLGSKTWAKVKAKLLFAALPASSRYLGNGQRAVGGGRGTGPGARARVRMHTSTVVGRGARGRHSEKEDSWFQAADTSAGGKRDCLREESADPHPYPKKGKITVCKTSGL